MSNTAKITLMNYNRILADLQNKILRTPANIQKSTEVEQENEGKEFLKNLVA